MLFMFLNIPEKFENQIVTVESGCFLGVCRGIRHLGDLSPKDFFPSFCDEEQKKAREMIRNKGEIGKAVFDFKEPSSLSECSVSLSLDLNSFKQKFWSTPSTCAAFPEVAIGNTDKSKGVANKDGKHHISYFLFDYENDNPYVDFSVKEVVE